MAGRYKAYTEYKDSPIDWLDEIPTHWTTKKLKHLGEAIIGLTYSPNEVVDGSDSNATLVLRSSNVQGQKITLNDNVFVNKEIPEKLTTRLNDILICSRNGSRALIGKNALIDKSSVGMSFGAFMTIYRSKHNTYLSHVMNSKLFEYQSGSFLTSTINQLTTGNLNSFEIPFPSEEERECIANFLDHETAKIDTLITKQEKLIELLKEKRQAVISHAVTKGLNPEAPMKDSGVEWLGEVPEHWDVSPLKHHCELIDGDRSSVYPNENDLVDTGVPFVSSKNIVEYRFTKKNLNYITEHKFNQLSRGKLKNGDLVITVRGTIGHVALFDSNAIGHPTGFINAQMMIIRLHTLSSRFLMFVCESNSWKEQMSIGAYGSTVKQLSNHVIGNAFIAIPPVDELVLILSHLEQKVGQVDNLLEKARSTIELMREKKTALISAAVTGKIDVRDFTLKNGEVN